MIMKVEFFDQQEFFASYQGDNEPLENPGKRMLDIISRSTPNTEIRINLDYRVDKEFWDDLCRLMLKYNIIKEE